MSKLSLTTDNVQRELRCAAQDVLKSALEDLSRRIRRDIRDEIRCCLPNGESNRPSSSSPRRLEFVPRSLSSTFEHGGLKEAGRAWPEFAEHSSSVVLSDAESSPPPAPSSPGRPRRNRGRAVRTSSLEQVVAPEDVWAQPPLEPLAEGRSPQMTNNWVVGEAAHAPPQEFRKQGTSIEADTLESATREQESLSLKNGFLRVTRTGTQTLPVGVSRTRSSFGSKWQSESIGESVASRRSTRHPKDLKKRVIKQSDLGVYFDWGMTAAIVANGIFMGVQTDHMARSRSDMQPRSFDILEIIFCAIFTFELVLKLARYRLDFFTMPEWKWNVFDLMLVVLQAVEVISLLNAMDSSRDSSTGDPAAGQSFSFLRLLRILRFFRTLRLIRLLEFFNELKLIVSSVVQSMRSLLWTLVLLGIMIYIVGIVFTQTVAQHRITHPERVDEDDLVQWWGTLPRSILSLYEAILGGVDWDDVVSPLMNHVHVLGALLFCLYIAFATLAMMNVITSIFVESALKKAEKEKGEDFERVARLIFNMSDTDASGEITREEYFNQISDPAFQACARTMGIDMQETAYLFDILDTNANDLINAEEMIKGLVHLRANATFMDIMSLKHDLELRAHQWESELSTMRGSQKEMHNIMNRMTQVASGGQRASAVGFREWPDVHGAHRDLRRAAAHRKGGEPAYGAYGEIV